MAAGPVEGAALVSFMDDLSDLPRRWLYFLSGDEDRNQGETAFLETYIRAVTEGRKVKANLEKIRGEIQEASKQGDQDRQVQLLRNYEVLLRQAKTS